MHEPASRDEVHPTAEDLQPTETPDPSPQLLAQRQSGANWFLWIAGLSVVNAVLMLLRADVHFVIGLGMADLVVAIGAEIAKNTDANVATIIHVVCFAISLGMAGVFAGFGAMARRGQVWAFVLGMALYAGDALLLLGLNLMIGPQGDWMSLAFHAFALYCLFSGLKAAIALNRSPVVQAAGTTDLVGNLHPIDPV
jgi:hypothetical protein